MGFKCYSRRCLLITTALWVIFFIGSLILAFIAIPIVINSIVAETVRLEKNTQAWDRFVDLPLPIKYKVYFFEILNADEVVNNGAKPNLTEKGPYVYRQKRTKNIFSVNDDDDTVTYEQNLKFTFLPDESVGNDTDEVLVAYTPLMGAVYELSALEKIAFRSCSEYIFPNKIFDRFVVKDILFDGIKFANKTNKISICNAVVDKVKQKAETIKNIEPTEDGLALKFSYFNYKTRPDGIYTVKRGIHSISTLGTVTKWNNMTHIHFYENKEAENAEICSLVRGTDSTLYPPNIEESRLFQIFNTDVCRTITLTHNGISNFKGIDGYLYETNINTMKPITIDSSKDCYCTHNKDMDGKKSCFLDGVLDIKPCIGTGVFASHPHFLFADPHYIERVDGLSPDEEKHNIHLVVEPNTGTPLMARNRIQLNVILSKQKGIKGFENVPSVTLPLLWVEESVELTDDLIDELKDKYFNKVKLATTVKYSLIAITALGSFVSLVFLLKITKQKHFD